jgi:hypothetical protein
MRMRYPLSFEPLQRECYRYQRLLPSLAGFFVLYEGKKEIKEKRGLKKIRKREKKD